MKARLSEFLGFASGSRDLAERTGLKVVLGSDGAARENVTSAAAFFKRACIGASCSFLAGVRRGLRAGATGPTRAAHAPPPPGCLAGHVPERPVQIRLGYSLRSYAQPTYARRARLVRASETDRVAISSAAK